jgi:hypothetical protein
MSIRHPIFARPYPRMAGAKDRGGMAEHRAALLADLTGRVIEIGAGNGANFPHYGRGRSGAIPGSTSSFRQAPY